MHYSIMGIILCFFAFILLFKSEYCQNGNSQFFDIHTSGAMRGFWCLIVILVHIPPQYQNTIQDMIGSFGYIGVTFFFMTSAYGLSITLHKRPDSIATFWKTRLPKLLIPNWTANIFFSLVFIILFLLYAILIQYELDVIQLIRSELNILYLIEIDGWILWLLGCYFIFWFCHKFIPEKHRIIMICVAIFGGSISLYIARFILTDNPGGWCTESIGFIWGILLAEKYDVIKEYFTEKWPVKVILSCCISLIIGLLYLKFKTVVFWGAYLLKIILGVSILCFILILNCKIKIGNSIVKYLGKVSFEVYLIHGYVFAVTAFIFPQITSGPFIIISMALTIFFASVVHKLSQALLSKIHL